MLAEVYFSPVSARLTTLAILFIVIVVTLRVKDKMVETTLVLLVLISSILISYRTIKVY